MTDITTTYLEAAIIDQKVAGLFPDKDYAFVAILKPNSDKWQLGVAVANEDGYSAIEGKEFDTWADAKEWADGLNRHIGRSPDDAAHITISTMGGMKYYPRRLH